MRFGPWLQPTRVFLSDSHIDILDHVASKSGMGQTFKAMKKEMVASFTIFEHNEFFFFILNQHTVIHETAPGKRFF